ncbi:MULTISPECIES: flagellar hook-basal body complex protein [Caproicibacterium]|uniref:Flagellar hook-basal body complex protein n=1 Tax=Caproicibacterium argilliputei TaxID=3030016 RepID=A0AA97D870_9FIRM|nr:flagellar hook-basal body complex protein [Caproicibacterium argilliputei]WOC31267.1 flagellar hook-basal body complex protein [Caproicibacterium argilliputei]
MSRAMYSGVAGMKAHQEKMDVIGNNIANVNTYGYKSQRAVFSDVYYQTLTAATKGTANKGGTNPSTVGVGSTLLGVQTMQTQSAMQNTGYSMDVAISGEGYFQVMDGSGNIFYTKAGMLGYDANTGYLTDINGNFVLGYQGTSKDGSGLQKIKLDQVGAVQPKNATYSQEINGNNFTLTAANATKEGNLSVNISSSDSLPIGQAVEATIANGTITVTLNSRSKFTSLDDLNTKINSAITVANGGKAIDAGDLTLSVDNADAFPAGGLTGDQIAKVNDGYDYGTISGISASGIFGGFKLDSVGAKFQKGNPADQAKFSIVRTPAAGTSEEYFTMTCKIGSKTYTGKVAKSQMQSPGKLVLSNGTSTTDTITMDYPNYSSVINSGKADLSQLKSLAVTDYKDPDFATEFKDGKVLGGIKVNGLADGSSVTSAVLVSNGKMEIKAKDKDGTETTYTSDAVIDLDHDFTNGSITVKNGSNSLTVSLPSKADFLSSLVDATTGTPGISYFDGTDPTTPDTQRAYNVTDTTKSKNLGLSSAPFVLADGTEGGTVTLNEISDIAIGSDGVVTVHNSDKGTVQVGQLCLATFANPAGLQAAGSNYYTASLNSGDPHVTTPGSDSSGELKTSELEMSNVDLATEFADMITTERGFQANSRIITVSDSMMEELINLKR